MNLPGYNGDISKLLGRQLLGPEQEQLNKSFGYDNARSDYEFTSGDNIYKVVNNNNGTRSVSLVDNLASRTTRQQKAEMDKRFTQNKQELGAFTDKLGQKVPQLQQEAEQKYGVTDLLGITNALNNRISELRTNSNNQGAGGFASAGQVDRAVSSNYLPQFNTAYQNLGTANTLANNYVDQGLEPIRTEGQLLADRIAREFTGYTQQQQNELDLLLNKMSQGFQMSENEKNRAAELAKLEKKYKYQLDLNKDPGSEKDNYLNIGKGSAIYDIANDKWITPPGYTGNGDTVNTSTNNVESYLNTQPNNSSVNLGFNPSTGQMESGGW